MVDPDRRIISVIQAAPDGVFAGSITGDEVERGKPAPDPYLAAAELVGVDPVACVAIEDSPTGVASALAAGCRTVAVPHMVAVEPRSGLTIWPDLAGRTIDDLAALGLTASGNATDDEIATGDEIATDDTPADHGPTEG